MKVNLQIPLDSKNDQTLTIVYLQKAWNGERFTCWKPGCNFNCEDPDEFVAHFQEHINEFLAGKLTERV